MQNKKGNVTVIAIIIIVSITAGIIGWMFAKKTQAPIQQSAVMQPTTPVAQNQSVVSTTQPVTNQEPVDKPIDETANWQTYSNAKYGIEMKYPQANWKIYSDDNSVFIEKKVISKKEKETGSNGAIINTSKHERTAEQIISGPYAGIQEELKNAKKIKINEIEAYETEHYQGWFTIWIFDKNYDFEIRLDETTYGNSEFNKIISTLRFTK